MTHVTTHVTTGFCYTAHNFDSKGYWMASSPPISSGEQVPAIPGSQPLVALFSDVNFETGNFCVFYVFLCLFIVDRYCSWKFIAIGIVVAVKESFVC